MLRYGIFDVEILCMVKAFMFTITPLNDERMRQIQLKW